MYVNHKVAFLTVLLMVGMIWMPDCWAGETLSLAGPWQVRLDSEKQGVSNKWFAAVLPLGKADECGQRNLPGSLDEFKLGKPNPKPPSLYGLYRPIVYEGPAWYQREIEIPEAWRGKRVRLFLERIMGESRVWLDERECETHDSLSASHVHELGVGLMPGKHRLTVCADNTRKVFLGYPSVYNDGTAMRWNGLIGRLELQAVDPVSVEDVQVYPDVDQRRAKVQLRLANASEQPAHGTIALKITDRKSGNELVATTVAFTAASDQTTISAELTFEKEMPVWDEFSPALCDLSVELTAVPEGGAGAKSADRRTVAFGMRQVATHGTRFTLNKRTIFLRGTLECCIFPLTGYPATDAASWLRIFRIMKAYGLNHVRFHSWCPPEAAFNAADQEGIIVEAEGPQANENAGKNPQTDAFLEQELLRMVRTYGNHPSFCMMALGNEFSGPKPLLSGWVAALRKADPRRLYTSATLCSGATNAQFTVGLPRGIQGPGTALDFRKNVARMTCPLVGHEVGEWAFFPNFEEIGKYTGVFAARNFELIRDDLAKKQLLELAPQYCQVAGRHAALLYKEEIELFLRTPGHGGFQLLDLHDYPGQGTAIVGLLDAFWDSKGFITPETHRRYCGPVVPLLRLPKRTYTADEPLTATAETANFGPADLRGVEPVWTICDEQGREVAAGALSPTNIPTGGLTGLGELSASFAKAHAPCKLTVTLALKHTDYANDWNIWVYPPSGGKAIPVGPAVAPEGVMATDQWPAAKQRLAEGGRVVFCLAASNTARSIRGSFFPVFWSPTWLPQKQGTVTMSILCDPNHPALAGFPTAEHTDWQWFNLLQHSRNWILDETPADYRPVIQVVDNFVRNHKLGLVLETRVGVGRLLAVAMDLPRLAETDPSARQLMTSLHAYAASPSFQPGAELDAGLLDRLFTPTEPRKEAIYSPGIWGGPTLPSQ